MHKLVSRTGATVSYRRSGHGAPLVLIHGGFSDHHTNWEFVLPKLEEHFTVVAMARRGRGETDVTEGHTIDGKQRTLCRSSKRWASRCSCWVIPTALKSH